MTIRGLGTAPSGDGDDMMIDMQTRQVCVPVPGGASVRVDPRDHREDVVRRLLLLGVSTPTLLTLLPDWTPLIGRVSAEVGSG